MPDVVILQFLEKEKRSGVLTPGSICSRYFRKNKNNRKTFQKIPKKITDVPEYGTHERVNFHNELTLWLTCAKKTSHRSENSNFWISFSVRNLSFFTGRPRCNFVAKFHTGVRTILRYACDFFRNFLKSFSIFYLPKNNGSIWARVPLWISA